MIGNYTFNSNQQIQSNKLFNAIPQISNQHAQLLHVQQAATAAFSNYQHSMLPPAEFEHYIPTAQEIEKYSLLNALPESEIKAFLQAGFNNPDNPNLNHVLRLAANTLAGGLMTGGSKKTQLDGLPVFSSEIKFFDLYYQQMAALIESMDLCPTSDEYTCLYKVLDGLDQLKNCVDDLKGVIAKRSTIANMAQCYAQKIDHLAIGHSQLLYGGYGNDSGGHAQIYEFKKTDATHFDVILYSSTGYDLIGSLQTEDKLKLKPRIIYKDVPAEVLLFRTSNNQEQECGASFIQALIEVNILSFQDKEKKVDDKDVLRIFSLLENYRQRATPIEDCGVITPQRGGTCVRSATDTLMRCWIGDIVSYRQMKFHSKLRYTIVTYQALKNNLISDDKYGDERRRVLKTAATRLIHQVAKCSVDNGDLPPLISSELAQQTRATAYDLLGIIEQIESTIHAERSRRVSEVKLQDINSENQILWRAGISSYKPASVATKAIPVKHLPNFDISLPKKPSGKAVIEFLQKGLAAVKQTVPSTSIGNTASILQVSHILYQLPIPQVHNKSPVSSFWNSLTTQQLLECMVLLEEIAKAYIPSYLGAERKYLPADDLTILLTLQALSHHLALKIDQAKNHHNSTANLNYYRTPFSTTPLQLDGLVYLDQKNCTRAQEVVNYFQNFNQTLHTQILFEHEKYTSIESNTIEQGYKPVAVSTYWNALLAENASLRDATLQMGKIVFPDYSKREIADKHDSRYPNVRLKNLPHITKQLAILETDVVKNSATSVLHKHGYSHVNVLRRMIYLTQESLHNLKHTQLTQFKPDKNPYSSSITIQKSGSTDKSLDQSPLLHKTPFSLSQQHQHTADLAIANRNMSRWKQPTAEGTTLSKLKVDKQETFLTRLERTFSQNELTPQQLMFEISSNLNEVCDPSLQNLLFRLFLRSPYQVNSDNQLTTTLFGVGEQIIKKEGASLRNQALALIAKGIDHFQDKPAGLDGARFFLQLSFYFAKFLSDANQDTEAAKFNLAARIDAWLQEEKNPPLKDTDQAALHYYRCLFLSLNKSSTEKHVVDMYSSWILSTYMDSNRSLRDKWHFPLLHNLAQQAIYRQTARLEQNFKDPSYCASIGALIANQLTCVLEEKTSAAWCIDPSLGYPYLSQGTYHIDLTGGLLFNHGHQIEAGYDIKPYLDRYAQLKRLFLSTEGWTFSKTENTVDCIRQQEHLKITLTSLPIVQRLFPKDGWLRQVNREAPGYSFPQPLIDDHCIWQYPSEKRGVITRLNSSEILYTYNEGIIYQIGSEYKVNYIDHLSVSKVALTEFETQKNILVFSDTAGTIQKITFPRYRSQEGNTLIFEKDGDNFVWCEDRRYALPEKGMPQGLLGTIPNYLYLKAIDQKSSDRLLIPFQHIDFTEAHYANGFLNLANRISPVPADLQPDSHEQEGCFRYFAYQVSKKEIKPTSQEGALFLAHLHLTQKAFGDAVDLFRQQRGKKLSSISKQILETIINFPLGEDHPDAKMASLHALILVMRDADSKSNELVKNYFTDNKLLKHQLKRYKNSLQSLNHISPACRLSADDERYLLEKGFQPLRKNASIVTTRLQLLAGQKVQYVEHNNTRVVSNIWQLKRPDKTMLYDASIPSKYLIDISLQWLREQSNLTQVLRAPRAVDLEKHGGLFSKAYEIAKQGHDGQRREMLFKLNLWRGDNTYPFLDLLAAILLQPHAFPDFLPNLITTSRDEQIQFLKAVWQSYASINRNGLEVSEKTFKSSSPQQQDTLSAEQHTDFIPKHNAYPYTTRSTLAPTLTIQPVAIGRQLLTVKIPENHIRWTTLDRWKTEFLIQDDGHIPHQHYVDCEFAQDASHSSSMQRDFKIQQDDYVEGKKQNNAADTYWKLDPRKFRNFHNEVVQEQEKVQERRHKLEEMLFSLANSIDKNHATHSQQQAILARIGTTDAPMTVDDCIHGLLSLDRRHYQKKFPHLTDLQIDGLAEITLELVDVKSEQAQLRRIVTTLTDITNNSSNQTLQNQLCNKLFKELDMRYFFEDKEYDLSYEEKIIFRIFAGQRGMLPFPKQIAMVKRILKSPYSVSQLMMGEGKTSVIAFLTLYLRARQQGRLALFVVPTELFDSVEANLNEAMQAFYTNVVALRYERHQLTSHKLEEIQADLQKSEDEQKPILTTLSTLQTFKLELLSKAQSLSTLSKAFKDAHQQQQLAVASNVPSSIAAANAHLEHLGKRYESARTDINLLHDIVKKISKQGDALFDEVDLLFDAYQQMNFPAGEKIGVNPDGNLLLQKIYKVLASDPDIKNRLRLCENKQKSFFKTDPDAYQREIVPIVASKLITDIEAIQDYVENHQEEYVRYVSGKMQPNLQQFVGRSQPLTEQDLQEDLIGCDLQQLQKDLHFLNYVKRLSQSKDTDAKKAADLIALSKHFLCELTPATLQKKGNRNYGLSKDENMRGKIVLYLGIDTPSPNEFGYHWEAAAYYYQYAAAFTPDERQVQEIASIAKRSAEYYMQYRGESLHTTAEYLDFQKIFGISLDDIDKPEQMQKALQHIGNDIDKRMKLQQTFITNYVSSHSERLSSTGIDAVDLVATCNAMSGTPWNVEGYEKKLAAQYFPDIGTGGRILHTLAKKANKDSILTTTDNVASIEEFMQQCFAQHSTPQCIRGLIEAGGVFDKFKSNADVAAGIASFLAEKQTQGLVDPKIKGVLFFHTDPGHTQPNTLYVWKLGASAPERIGGTSPEALEAKGLLPENYFVYYDEKHTTGTDIAQIPDAINLITYENTPKQKVKQAVMRLRQLFYGQNVSFVVSQTHYNTLLREESQSLSVNDIIIDSVKAQSERKIDAMERHYQQQIQHIFTKEAAHQICAVLDNNILSDQIIDAYMPFISSSLEDKPYQQHGSLVTFLDTKEMLKEQVTHKLENFKAATTSAGAAPSVLNCVSIHANEQKEWCDSSKVLPELSKHTHAGIGIEMTVEQQVEIQQEVNIETETEIDLELQNYAHNALEIKSESVMNEKMFLALLAEVRDNSENKFITFFNNTTTLQKQLKSYPYKIGNRALPYHKAFSEKIHGTYAYFNTVENATLAVFHELQRPPKQILAIQNSKGDIRWLLLSEFEAGYALKHLTKLYNENAKAVDNVWLIQPDGSTVLQNKGMDFPAASMKARRGLLEINAFGGYVHYLDTNTAETEQWLSEDSEIKLRFLKVKTVYNKEQRQILNNSHCLNNQGSGASGSIYASLFPGRLEREKNRQGNYTPASDVLCKIMDPAENGAFGNLRTDYVALLGIDWAKRNSDSITKEALCKLKISTKAKDDAQLKIEAEQLTQRQLNALQPHHIPHLKAEQLALARLPKKSVLFLKHPSQIYIDTADGNRRYLLNKKQVNTLTRQQEGLIPGVNPEYYKDFQKFWQIASIPASYFAQAKTLNIIYHDGWSNVNSLQIKALPKELMGQLIEQKLLNDTQIDAFHGNHIDVIPVDRVKNISKEQIQEIDDPEVIAQLETIARKHGIAPGTWTQWLTSAQVALISPQQLTYLNADQVGVIEANVTKQRWKELRTHLEPSQVRSTTNAQLINHLSKDYLLLLQDKAAIQKVSYKNVQHLTREQLRQRSWAQFFIYTLGVITLGVAANVTTLLAHLTLIPYGYKKIYGTQMPLMNSLSKHRRRLHRYFEVYSR